MDKRDIGYLPQSAQMSSDFPSSVNEAVLSGRLNSMGKRAFSIKRQAGSQKLWSLWTYTIFAEKASASCQEGRGRGYCLRGRCALQKLLVLDEPAAALDPGLYEMYQLVKRINDEMGITILMVSHDCRSAIEFASHILHLGRTRYFYGLKEDYIESDIGKNYLCIWGCEHHVH